MQFTAVGGLEGDRTDGALVKYFTVFLFNVSLLPLKGLENHVTVKTSGRKGNILPLFCFHGSAWFIIIIIIKT